MRFTRSDFGRAASGVNAGLALHFRYAREVTQISKPGFWSVGLEVGTWAPGGSHSHSWCSVLLQSYYVCLLLFKCNFPAALANPTAVKVTSKAPLKHRNETSQLAEALMDSVAPEMLQLFAAATS